MEKAQTETVWRESASLIIAAKNSADSKKNDYNLLLLKRSSKTAFAPNQAVFPGGLLDEADESADWMKYFEEFGVSQTYLKTLLVLCDNRPKILAPQGNGCYDRFFKKSTIWAREISLRLTAIRETFEEVGILLCRTRQQLDTNSEGFGFYFDNFNKAHWQQVVHNDPKQFLNLCRQLQVVPDLWSLSEWSAWASPAPVRKGYETVFFIVCLSAKPTVLAEPSEVEEIMWNSPKEICTKYQNDEVWFLPPQIYELLRLLGVDTINALKTFARERGLRGTTLYLPVGYMCTDGMVSVLPGDDFYLKDPRSPKKFISLDMTKEAFRKNTKNVHRCENVGMPNIKVYLNFEPLDAHLAPIKISYDNSKL